MGLWHFLICSYIQPIHVKLTLRDRPGVICCNAKAKKEETEYDIDDE